MGEKLGKVMYKKYFCFFFWRCIVDRMEEVIGNECFDGDWIEGKFVFV